MASLLGELEGVEIVGQAGDAGAARTLAEELRPDVAILDVRLSQGSGVEVLGDIKRCAPESKIIMLTNFVDPENRNACIDHGADYFFDKSIELEKAVALLQGMLQGDRQGSNSA